MPIYCVVVCFFFFNDTATTEIYTLSVHDALPISRFLRVVQGGDLRDGLLAVGDRAADIDRLTLRVRRPHIDAAMCRSEEHTSELQSPCNLVCRLLLEKKTFRIFTHLIPCALCLAT